jgi:AcrR family transcriptional regulator
MNERETGKVKNSDTNRTIRTRQASRSRRESQKQELREIILAEASREFLEHGYENFSLRRVAERIGYTPTTIYLYFRNKDELLLETVQDGFTQFDEAIAAAAKGPRTPLKRIEALGRAYIQFGLDHPSLYRLMFMQRSDFYFMPRLVGRGSLAEKIAPTQNEMPQHRAVAQELLISAVEDAIAQKLIPRQDAVQTADTLWAGVHGVVALSTSPLMTREQAEAVGDQLLQLLIRGLKPQVKR